MLRRIVEGVEKAVDVDVVSVLDVVGKNIDREDVHVVELIHDAAVASGVHRNCFADRAVQYGIDPALGRPAVALFQQALAEAETDEVKKRVERASIGAYRLAIEPVEELSHGPRSRRNR